MKIISPSELNQRLKKKPKISLLDVRTSVEYQQVHVRQA
jgi:rhodanese-related sulfurtransferase